MSVYEITNLIELEKIAQNVIKKFTYKTVAFYGEMGVGKTTFIKKIIELMNTKDVISSPTYSIVNEYKTAKGNVYHFDFYRIKKIEEAYDMGVEEYLDTNNYCFVEWPERIPELLNMPHHVIKIELIDNKRIIQFI